MAGFRWVCENRAVLGISKLVVQGESTGGRLTLAPGVALKRAGEMDLVDGFYVQCPYISNAYEPASEAFPSLAENDAVSVKASFQQEKSRFARQLV